MNELTNYAFNSFWSIWTIFEAFVDEISLSEREFRCAISKKESDQHRQIILGTTERSEIDAIFLECQERVEFSNRFLKSFQYRLLRTDDDNGAPTPEFEIPSISDILPWLLEERDLISLECRITEHLQQMVDLWNRHHNSQLRLEMIEEDDGGHQSIGVMVQ